MGFTSFFIISLFLLLEVMAINFSLIRKLIKKFIGVILIIPVIVTFVFMCFYGKIEFLYWIDDLLTSRVEYVYLIFEFIKPNLFGIK